MVTSLRASYIATTIGVARIAWQVERRRRRSPRDSLDTDAPHEGVEAGRCHDPGERQLTFAVVLDDMRRTAPHVDQALGATENRVELNSPHQLPLRRVATADRRKIRRTLDKLLAMVRRCTEARPDLRDRGARRLRGCRAPPQLRDAPMRGRGQGKKAAAA